MDQKSYSGEVPQDAGIQSWVFNEIMDRMHANIYVTDLETEEILFMNKTMKRAFGLEHPEGQRCWEVLQDGMGSRCSFCPMRYLDPKDAENASYIWEEHNTKNGHIYRNYDSLMRWTDGRLVHFQHSVDVTLERRLSREAMLDDLTGVLNRRAGRAVLEEWLDSGRPFVLCMLDLNALKQVNDTQGHQAGDAFLIAVVQAVQAQLAPQDCIFRMSGDAFVVLMGCADLASAGRRMRAAQDALRSSPDEGDRFSFGVAEAPEGGKRISADLLRDADADLYTHKRQLHIQRAEEKLQQSPPVPCDPRAFTYDQTLLYDALVRSTDDYLYVCNMKTGVFRYPQTMVDEFGLPGQVVENAAAVWGSHVHAHDKAAFLEANQDITDGRTDSHCVEYRAKNRNGQWVWLRCRGHLERDAEGNPSLFAGFITNLGNKNQFDHMTGLYNKLAFEAECSRLLNAGKLTLMLFGIDDLKRINSLYDHGFGDEVIRVVSQRIQSLLPPNAQVFRLDGDEFGVLIRGAAPETAGALFQSIHSAFSTQQTYDNRKFFCTLSCGCVLAPRDGDSYLELVKRAAYALESAKRSGKDRLVFFTPEDLPHMERALELTELLRESIERDFAGFQVYYQPVFDLDRKLIGAEALCRWSCEKYGAVPPGEFIPLLESSGLILRVGRWIFRQAAKQCTAFLSRAPHLSMSVNLSWLQLEDSSLPAFLQEVLAEHDLSPAHIILELTESCLAANLDGMAALLESLRRAGFLIAMDDFGTGYSSLGLLKRAPIDIVKLDGTFVRGIQESAFDQAFIRLAAELCHIVGIRVCLEGVETEAEFDAVRLLELDFMQGFLLGRPCRASAFLHSFLPDHSHQGTRSPQ